MCRITDGKADALATLPPLKAVLIFALVDDVLRRGHHNETIGILICGSKNDRSVRYSLGRSTSPMAVAAYTYDKLPPAEQHALPDEGHIVSALEWAEPESAGVRSSDSSM
jgi:hypothetical protein